MFTWGSQIRFRGEITRVGGGGGNCLVSAASADLGQFLGLFKTFLSYKHFVPFTRRDEMAQSEVAKLLYKRSVKLSRGDGFESLLSGVF